MEIFRALLDSAKKKDSTPMERLEVNRVRTTIEDLCEEHLTNSDDLFKFEALPSAIDAVLATLEGEKFQEKYEFQQVDETIFVVRLKELNIL